MLADRRKLNLGMSMSYHLLFVKMANSTRKRLILLPILYGGDQCDGDCAGKCMVMDFGVCCLVCCPMQCIGYRPFGARNTHTTI